MVDSLGEYVENAVERGECKCGRCIDVGAKSDPTGHTVDMVFFKCALRAGAIVDGSTFRKLSKELRGEFLSCDPYDGKEHSYIELGGWIGDQGLALRYMALGVLLKEFQLLSPRTVLGEIEDSVALNMAGQGLLSIYLPSAKEMAA